MEDESGSDSPGEKQSAARLLSPNNSNAPVKRICKQFHILCVMNLNFFKPAGRPTYQCGGLQQSPSELENRGFPTVFSRGKPNPHCVEQSLLCIPSIF